MAGKKDPLKVGQPGTGGTAPPPATGNSTASAATRARWSTAFQGLRPHEVKALQARIAAHESAPIDPATGAALLEALATATTIEEAHELIADALGAPIESRQDWQFARQLAALHEQLEEMKRASEEPVEIPPVPPAPAPIVTNVILPDRTVVKQTLLERDANGLVVKTTTTEKADQ
jgi:hypothetical protein